MSSSRPFARHLAANLALVLAAAACGAEDPALSQSTSAATEARATLRFGADWSEVVSGPLMAGGQAIIAYDTSRLEICKGEQGGVPQWGITGHYSLDGGERQTVDVFSPNNPTGKQPVIALERAGTLELWFEATSRWGCHEWDSDFGHNYRFEVSEKRNMPSWVGNATSVISRATCDAGGPCPADFRRLEDGFTYDTWARQRAFIAAVYFEAWEPGLTDWDNPDMWWQLEVQLHHRFDAAEEFEASYVDLDRRTGNNARYAVSLRELDPLGGNTITDAADCPKVPLTPSADGNYVSTDVEFFITVNDVELRPAGGGTYRGQFVDYRGLYAPCL
jgi:hypothetical protein